MITMIIAFFAIGFLSVFLKGSGGKVRDARLMKETNETFLPSIIELESFGFQVIGRDPAIKATIERGRRNRGAYLKGADAVAIEETIAACIEDRDTYMKLQRGISAIKSHCNVDIVPDLREEVEKYKRISKRSNELAPVMYAVPDYKEDAKRRFNEMKPDLMPYYVSDQLEALDGLITSLYARIELLREEQTTTFNDLHKFELEEKINKLLLQASKKEQEADRIRTKYAKEWR